jgi:Xaa-Pro aminopeptidase
VLVPAVPAAVSEPASAAHRFEEFVQRVEGLGAGLRALGRDAERCAETLARSGEVRQRLAADLERLRGEAAALAERTVRLRAQREDLVRDLYRAFAAIADAAARWLERAAGRASTASPDRRWGT